VDPANVVVGRSAAGDGLRHSVHDQLHRHLLPRFEGHPLWHDGSRDVHLPVCDPAADSGGHRAGPQPRRPARLPLPHQRSAQTHSGEEVVHGAGHHRLPRGNSPLWFHLY